MRLILAVTALLLSHSVWCEEASWNWNGEKSEQMPNQAEQNPEYVEDFQASPSEYVENNLQLNNTAVDQVIDEILSSTREGKALNGFDEVYSDPNIQDVLQKGDETEARNLIKERLCNLGLMKCEDNIEGKRPYISPEELIYAQPVAINPVGKPIPTIPIKGVRGGGYGPPRPPSYPPSYSSGKPGSFGPPPSNKFGPPPPNNFGPPPSNKYGSSNSYGSSSSYGSSNSFGSSSHGFSQSKPPRRQYGPVSSKPGYGKPPLTGEYYDSPEIFSKPPFLNGGEFIESVPPYKFENGAHQSGYHKDKRVEITVNAQGGAVTASGGSSATAPSVEHVHHHYHHNLDGVNKPTVVVNPIPIAAAAVSTDLSSVSNTFNSASSSFGTGFKPTGGLGSFSSSNGVFGSTVGGTGLNGGFYGGKQTVNYGLNSFDSVRPVTENYGAQSFDSFGTSVGSYGSSNLYKKELNINPINNNYLQSNYADKYQGLESARAENYDCICVPYDQCPSYDVIGRKDDLYLPLDPRSLKSDIEALPALSEEERVITDGNGTMTVVKVVKSEGLNSTVLEETNAEKKISKREVPADQKSQSTEQKAEGRQYGISGLDMKKIKPTFGISFGLPQQGGGGYPISPYGPNPLVNPYGNTIGGGGINLGLVSVNPLISVQVSKDDYGQKEIKPFVNLHVTPNNYLVHKFEDLLAYKKHIVFNKHKHYHVHKGHPHYEYPHHEYSSPPHYHSGSHEIYEHGPPHHSGPYLEHPPIHSSHYPVPHAPEPLTDEFYGPPHESYPGNHHESYPGNHHEPYPGNHHEPYPGNHHESYPGTGSYYDNPLNYGGGEYDPYYGRAYTNSTYVQGNSLLEQYQNQYQNGDSTYSNNLDSPITYPSDKRRGKSFDIQNVPANPIKFPSSRKRRQVTQDEIPKHNINKRQFYGGAGGRPQTCGPRHVCCKRPNRPNIPGAQANRQCGSRHSQGINGRIKNPVYVDGDSEFGEYPWQVAILKKDPKESVYVCGGTLIDPLHIITAAHCVKTYTGFDLRVRLGEWDVNHDVEFYPYIERDVVSVHVHPEFYAGTLYNDLAILRMDKPVDWSKYPHISPACLPHPQDDYTGARCWTTGWGKDAFGDFGKYQNILKEVDVPILNSGVCQRQLQNTRLGYDFQLHPGFICAGGEEGKDACKGDGGGPMVCERGGTWQVVGVVSWGIGCGQVGVPGVYVKVAHYLDWIRQITQRY